MGIVSEFREFALKGNVVDLAVGVIIGAAFGGVTKSMVDDIIMPPIGRLVGNLDFGNLYISLSDKIDQANTARAATQPSGGLADTLNVLHTAARLPLAEARALGPVIAYGTFLTNVLNFVIVAFCVFMLVKLMNIAKRRFEQQQAAAPPAPTKEEVLLTEIRDILKEKH